MYLLGSLYPAIPYKVHAVPIPEPPSVVLLVAGLVIGVVVVRDAVTRPRNTLSFKERAA
jgi:hypothetical protein